MDTFKEQQQLTDLYNSGRAPWEVWKARPERRRAPGDAPAGAAAARARAATSCCASARTATTSRSAAAARCCGSCGSCRSSASPGSSCPATPSAAARGPARRAAGARPPPGRPGRPGASATASSPTSAVPIKEFFEQLKREVAPGSGPHPLPRGPAPGPPARLRPDLQHLPRPPDPRVRDPEDRRRPRQPQRLRAARRRRPCAGRSRSSRTASASQRDKRWFSEDAFRGLMRLRGVEAGAPSGYAEAFYGRKLVI